MRSNDFTLETIALIFSGAPFNWPFLIGRILAKGMFWITQEKEGKELSEYLLSTSMFYSQFLWWYFWVPVYFRYTLYNFVVYNAIMVMAFKYQTLSVYLVASDALLTNSLQTQNQSSLYVNK